VAADHSRTAAEGLPSWRRLLPMRLSYHQVNVTRCSRGRTGPGEFRRPLAPEIGAGAVAPERSMTLQKLAAKGPAARELDADHHMSWKGNQVKALRFHGVGSCLQEIGPRIVPCVTCRARSSKKAGMLTSPAAQDE
jgi:hypothetical protein